ncbi:MAG: AbrB/MazE/SpoVT family DNA-binding domain-containing protein [Acidobacteria bacterium]|nr:AbrB/MazE/SpoVT family DNA-binding domain-containing protein [Acidobacteriota bacterium]
MRVTTKGQVTIPIEIREQFGFLPHTEVRFVVDGESVRLVRGQEGGKERGRHLVGHLTGKGSVRMTTDEIMALTRGEP